MGYRGLWKKKGRHSQWLVDRQCKTEPEDWVLTGSKKRNIVFLCSGKWGYSRFMFLYACAKLFAETSEWEIELRVLRWEGAIKKESNVYTWVLGRG